VPNPTYEHVCTGTTGHAEVVQVRFDPTAISFRDLLDVFFTMHDPTTLNRQGPDSGTQYRSAIFHASPEQQRVAQDTIAELEASKTWTDRVVTEVTPLDTFYPAEDYHNEYFRRNRNQPYCQAIIEPKVARLRQRHLARLKQPAD
jgi:peptide-methionine (S)-S-oxide reductase